MCVSGCGRYLAPRDGHERCFACLGLAHAEAAFVDESCTHCGMMTISELRSRLQLLQRGGVPVPLPRSNPPQRVAASGDTGDLRITVSAFPSGNQPPRKPHFSCTPQPAELPEERGGPSQRCAPSVSFGAPLDDRMSIDFAGDDASAQLSPSGTVAVPDTDPEMMAMLSRAANRVGLVWNPPPCPEPSRLDDWFLGVARAGSQSARLTEERAQSVLNCLNTFRGRTAVPLKLFQRLLGHMAAAAAVIPLGLLHMRPLQHWFHGRVPRWAWQRGTYRVAITPECRQTFSPWSDHLFLRAGVALEQVSRHAVVFTDASATGWGATCNGQAVSGVWTGPQRHWHINCLELLAVYLALGRLKGPLRGKHVLVRTDNTATVAYINRQGGLHSRRMSQLARHLLLWGQKHLRSLRAIHVPGVLNRVAEELSRAALPGEWRLHPQVVQLIWGEFGEAQVDLFASLGTSHCQLFYSLSEGTLGTDALAHSWPRGLCKYAFPPVSLLSQTLCKVREDEERVLLVAPYWPNRTWFPEFMLLATAPPWLVPLRKDLLSQRRGTLWHPRPDLWKLHVWSLDGTRRY